MKKVAIYKDRVAVQLPTRVVLYELAPGPDGTPCELVMAAPCRRAAACPLPASFIVRALHTP